MEVLGVSDLSRPPENDVLHHRTRGGSPLEVLVRLFLTDLSARAEDARRSVAPTDLSTWMRAGLIELDGDHARATVRVAPWGGLFLAHDPPGATGPDQVMGLAPSSISMLQAMIRRPSASTLDLGAGCGVLALSAAAHSARVVAVDCNPRALGFTRWNAMFNGVATVESSTGDLFEPVLGERFDHVVANPPFVISPGVRKIFRDGGASGDGLSRRILTGMRDVLADGGFAQMLCTWLHVRGEDDAERISGWIRDSGCDALVLRGETLDSVAYCARWSESGAEAASGDFTFAERIAYLEQQHVEAVSLGLVTMRRTSGRAGWVQVEDAPMQAGAFGTALLRRFANRDYLDTVREDEHLLAARLRPAADLHILQDLTLGPQGWRTARVQLTAASGLGAGEVDTVLAEMIKRLGAGRRLEDVVVELAGALGSGPEALSGVCADAARSLIEQGFLEPASSTGEAIEARSP